MNAINVGVGLIAIGLFVYLLYALIKPEKF
jgi:K+-transporting ATPase KdpF subunit